MKNFLLAAVSMVAPKGARRGKTCDAGLAQNTDPASIENFRKIHAAKGFTAKDAYKAFGEIRYVK